MKNRELNDGGELLAEFVALLAMLPSEEHYAVAVELIEIAEKHGGQMGSA